MYKCKECGCEYKEKPDFCDCGNDEFDIIVPAAQEEIKSENITENKEANKPEKIYTPTPKVIERRGFAERYPGLANFFRSIDPISGGIFLGCIFLSIYVILFAWNPAETTITDQKTEVPVQVAQIPASIDKFWNNALPVITEDKKQEEPKIVEEVKKIVLPVKTQPVQIPVKTTPKTTTVKLTKVTPKLTTQNKTTAKTTQTKKTSQIPAKTTQVKTQQVQTPVKNQTPTVSQKTSEQIAAEQAEQAKKAAEQLAAQKAEQARKAAQAKVEYANYKAALRNTIGRKIDFTRVIGDGSCTVAFKINSSGKLVNRSFAKQSSNITLNDAVYAAVMATPTYNPPPSAYNNETLNLNISFYNGNFEISLK